MPSGTARHTFPGDEGLRFPPPFGEHAVDRTRFVYAWRMLQFCFEIRSPTDARPLGGQFPTSESELIARFVDKAKVLASSPFLGAESSLSVRSGTDGLIETVDPTFPHEENERGFLTLLRQFAHSGETASFKAVQRIAISNDAARGSINHSTLTRWGKYHKKLLARPPDVWAYMKRFPGHELTNVPGGHAPRVDQMLRAYFYGEVIHFGEGRDVLVRLSEDEFSTAWNRLWLHKGASGLAMYYMGYAQLLSVIYRC